MQSTLIGETLTSTGGSFTTPIAVGASTATIKAAPGRLCRVSVTTAGTTSITFFDNPSAASGTVLWVSPATTTLGTVFDIQMPAQTGITVSNTSTGPAVTVSWD